MPHILVYILILGVFSFVLPAFAGDPTVFDVRKPIALSDKEKTEKDYYINAGAEAGLSKGMIITVVRKVPLYDNYQSRSAGDLNVPVAKVKIIQVQQGNSVARFQADIGRNDVPVLEEQFILVGDKLDLSTATHDKKSASNDGGDGEDGGGKAAPEPKKEPPPVTLVPALPAPPAAQVTSEKVNPEPKSPKEPGLGLAPTEGPTIR